MKYKGYIILLITLFLVSCQLEEPQNKGGFPIYISAATQESLAVENKVKSPYTATSPSSSNPLSAYILISTTEHEWDNNPSNNGTDAVNGVIGVHSHATFQSSESQLLSGALYNSNPAKQPVVYFCALYPQTNWNIAGNVGNKNYIASYIFNGTEDIMFAPVATGRYDTHPDPTLTFKHLLTWLKVSISAQSEEVAAAWGKITSMKLDDIKNKVIIDLSKDFDIASSVSFSGTIDMPFFSKGTNSQFPAAGGYSLKTNKEELAYVLCNPVDALATDPYDNSILMPEYILNIQTTNKNVTLEIDLKESANTYFTGSTIGKQFSIHLKFMMGNSIAVQALVTDWQTGGIGVGDVIE